MGPHQARVCAVICYSFPLSGPQLPPLYTKGTGLEFLGAPRKPIGLTSPIKKQPDSCLPATCFILSLHFPFETKRGSPTALQEIAGRRERGQGSKQPCCGMLKGRLCKPPFLIRSCHPAKIGLNLCDVHSWGEPPLLWPLALLLPGSPSI